VGDEGLMLRSVELVLFDLAGTTVDDRIAGVPLVTAAIVESFAEAGYRLGPEDVLPYRGRQKLEMVRCLLAGKRKADDRVLEEEAERIHDLFLTRVSAGIDRLNEIEGASGTFRFLKSRGIRVGVTSGFPAEIVERIVTRMSWMEQGLVDYKAGADGRGAGRPDPGMIHHAMQGLGIGDPKRVLKVGDTVVDVEEGKNAGTWTAAVLTGLQPEEVLRAAGADFVLSSVAALPELFG
jgi:phosphonatase-like hydrolase